MKYYTEIPMKDNFYWMDGPNNNILIGDLTDDSIKDDQVSFYTKEEMIEDVEKGEMKQFDSLEEVKEYRNKA